MAQVCGHTEFMQSTLPQNVPAFHVNFDCLHFYAFSFSKIFLANRTAPLSLQASRDGARGRKRCKKFHSIPNLGSQVQILLIFQVQNVQAEIFKVNCRFFRPEDSGNIWHGNCFQMCTFLLSLTFCTFWPDKDVRPQSNILNWNNTIRLF